jgi:hypothetical protein
LLRSDSSLTLALEITIHKPITHKGVNFVYNLLPQPSLQIKMGRKKLIGRGCLKRAKNLKCHIENSGDAF